MGSSGAINPKCSRFQNRIYSNEQDRQDFSLSCASMLNLFSRNAGRFIVHLSPIYTINSRFASTDCRFLPGSVRMACSVERVLPCAHEFYTGH